MRVKNDEGSARRNLLGKRVAGMYNGGDRSDTKKRSQGILEERRRGKYDIKVYNAMIDATNDA